MEMGDKNAIDHVSQIQMRMGRLGQLSYRKLLQVLIVEHCTSSLAHFADARLGRLVRQSVVGGLRHVGLARATIQKGKVRELLLVDHMYAAVEHD